MYLNSWNNEGANMASSSDKSEYEHRLPDMTEVPLDTDTIIHYLEGLISTYLSDVEISSEAKPIPIGQFEAMIAAWMRMDR